MSTRGEKYDMTGFVKLREVQKRRLPFDTSVSFVKYLDI